MISQNQNKRIRSLHQKKFREQHGLFIVEGKRSVKEALEANAPVDLLVMTESFLQKNPDLTGTLNNEIVSESEMKKLSPSVTPSGILGICKIPQFEKPNLSQNFIYLDHISDPGNMGTILRTAAWFGINQIALSDGCIDPFNPKVIRSAMGAHFHLSWLGTLNLNNLDDHTILGADHRGTPLDILENPPEKWALVMGSEAHGMSEDVKSTLDQTVAIPKIGKGESLNVGVAMGILLHHLTC